MQTILRQLLAIVLLAFAVTPNVYSAKIATPQPTICVIGDFSSVRNGTNDISVSLKMTNLCVLPVNFQNSTITFMNRNPITAPFTGDFGSLPQPDNELIITSQWVGPGQFLASLKLHFPEGSNTYVLPNQSFTLHYKTTHHDFVYGSVRTYIETPVDTGKIELSNGPKPANVTQDYALVHLTFNGGTVSVQAPWGTVTPVNDLAAGQYEIAPEDIVDTNGNSLHGTADPSSVTVASGTTAASTITYSGGGNDTGSLGIQLSPLPTEITTYTEKPTVDVINNTTGASTSILIDWNTVGTVSGLEMGNYNFSTQMISYDGYNCTPTFSPDTLQPSQAQPLPVTQLTYACVAASQSRAKVQVSGAPHNIRTLTVSFTPNTNSAPIIKTLHLTNGNATEFLKLTTGTVYKVSAEDVAGYTINFTPKLFTASENAALKIKLSPAKS